MRPRHLLILMAVAIVVSTALTAGCTIPGDNVSKGSTPDNYDPYGGPYATPSPAPQSSADTGVYLPTQPTVAPDASADVGNRKVIMTAYLQVETTRFDEVVGQVRALASGGGGYVQSSSLDTHDDNRKTCTIAIKVPQASYESTLEEIHKLGTVKTERSTGSDVTGTYVDLNARLKNAQASEARLLDIMGETNTTSDVLAVERELTRMQGEVEVLTAQLNTLTSRVDFSTITVYVTEPQPLVAFDWGIGQAVGEAAHAFVGMIGGLIVLTGYLVPLAIYFLLILAGTYLAIRGALWLYERRKRKPVADVKKP